jgi:hypothetical protein
VQLPSLEIVVDHLRVPPLQTRILGAIWKGKGHPVQTEMILAAMDRGIDVRPAHTYDEMKIALHHLRKRLMSTGITIESVGYRRGYRLVVNEASKPRRG